MGGGGWSALLPPPLVVMVTASSESEVVAVVVVRAVVAVVVAWVTVTGTVTEPLSEAELALGEGLRYVGNIVGCIEVRGVGEERPGVLLIMWGEWDRGKGLGRFPEDGGGGEMEGGAVDSEVVGRRVEGEGGGSGWVEDEGEGESADWVRLATSLS